MKLACWVPSARLTGEEQERRRRKHQRGIARLWEKRAKRKRKEDDERDARLFKRMAEMSKVTVTQMLEYRKRVFESRVRTYGKDSIWSDYLFFFFCQQIISLKNQRNLGTLRTTQPKKQVPKAELSDFSYPRRSIPTKIFIKCICQACQPFFEGSHSTLPANSRSGIRWIRGAANDFQSSSIPAARTLECNDQQRIKLRTTFSPNLLCKGPEDRFRLST